MLQTLHRLHPFICTGLGQCLPAGAPLQVLEEAGDASSWFTFFRLSLGRQFKLLLRDAELVQGRLIQVRAGAARRAQLLTGAATAVDLPPHPVAHGCSREDVIDGRPAAAGLSGGSAGPCIGGCLGGACKPTSVTYALPFCVPGSSHRCWS